MVDNKVDMDVPAYNSDSDDELSEAQLAYLEANPTDKIPWYFDETRTVGRKSLADVLAAHPKPVIDNHVYAMQLADGVVFGIKLLPLVNQGMEVYKFLKVRVQLGLSGDRTFRRVTDGQWIHIANMSRVGDNLMNVLVFHGFNKSITFHEQLKLTDLPEKGLKFDKDAMDGLFEGLSDEETSTSICGCF